MQKRKKWGNAVNDTPRKIKVKGSVVSCYVTLACLAHILTASFLPELPFIPKNTFIYIKAKCLLDLGVKAVKGKVKGRDRGLEGHRENDWTVDGSYILKEIIK